MVALANPGLPIAVVRRKHVNDVVGAGATAAGGTVNRKGALVILHYRIEVIGAVIIETHNHIEVMTVSGLYVGKVDGDVVGPVRSSLGVGKTETMSQFMGHNKGPVPIGYVDNLLPTGAANL